MSRAPLAVNRPAPRIAAPDGSRLTAHGSRNGITLIELLIVMAIVSLMLGIAYPNVVSGLDGIRLKTNVDRVASFWSAARQRADRYQEVIQVTIDTKKREVHAASAHSPWSKVYQIDEELAIAEPKEPISYVLYPGAPSPQFLFALETSAGGRSGLKVDVLSGLPEEWEAE